MDFKRQLIFVVSRKKGNIELILSLWIMGKKKFVGFLKKKQKLLSPNGRTEPKRYNLFPCSIFCTLPVS